MKKKKDASLRCGKKEYEPRKRQVSCPLETRADRHGLPASLQIYPNSSLNNGM